MVVTNQVAIGLQCFFPTKPDGEGDGAAEFMDPLAEKPSSTYIYNKHVLQSP